MPLVIVVFEMFIIKKAPWARGFFIMVNIMDYLAGPVAARARITS